MDRTSKNRQASTEGCRFYLLLIHYYFIGAFGIFGKKEVIVKKQDAKGFDSIVLPRMQRLVDRFPQEICQPSFLSWKIGVANQE